MTFTVKINELSGVEVRYLSAMPMVVIVVGLNVLIALGCGYIAWQIWQLRRVLAQVADSLTRWEINIHHGLEHAPEHILQAQANTATTRDQYQILILKLRRLRQILVLIGVGQRLWGRQIRRQRQQRRFPLR